MQPDRRVPVARDAERAAPAVRDRYVAQDREQLAERGCAARRKPASLRSNPASDARTEVVRRAASAEHHATVGAALAVDDQVPEVAERLALGSPISSHIGSGSGSVATMSEYTGASARRAARQPRGVALGRADDDVGAHRAAFGVRPRPARSPVTRVRSWTVAPRASTTAASPRTSFAGWIAAQCGVYVAPRTCVASQPLAVPRPRRAGRGRARTRRTRLPPRGRAASCGPERASTTVPPTATSASMPLGVVATFATSYDRVLHRAVLRDSRRRVRPRRRGSPTRHRVQRRAPTAVASGRAEAGDLGLEHGDAQRRVGGLQVVRRPQAR